MAGILWSAWCRVQGQHQGEASKVPRVQNLRRDYSQGQASALPIPSPDAADSLHDFKDVTVSVSASMKPRGQTIWCVSFFLALKLFAIPQKNSFSSSILPLNFPLPTKRGSDHLLVGFPSKASLDSQGPGSQAT